MQAIWKYPLDLRDKTIITMPNSSRVLCVQVQNGLPHIWVLVADDKLKVDRTFHTYGTGHKHETITSRYIGTYQLGALVFHVFEETT